MTSANDNPNPNFSDVGGSGSNASSAASGGTADFSDVEAGGSTTAQRGGTTYTVKQGDSLSKIAKHFYGSASKWKKIHAANADKIPNPDLIHPGLQLTIPEAGEEP
ncbi:MAG: LysM peptidoglycan-binding domain-containing protein [Gemmatimonadaceae bacterium]